VSAAGAIAQPGEQPDDADRGAPAHIQIAAKEILSLTRRYAEIIAKHANRDVDEVMRDIDRDRFLGPEDAIEYGLADRVLHTREEAA